MKCPACDSENGDKAKFCNECGKPMPKPAAPLRLGDDRAERRQLTVMFCDLVGSTELSARLDPEDLREVIFAYQDAAQHVIAEYDGHIAQYLGDGLLVYFGYPRAHEDDAERSIRAGLGIVARIQAESRRIERDVGTKLSVRIGIHTGPTVIGSVGSGGAEEQLAIGETPNIAARIQALAEPDAVVVSADTGKLVRNVFELQALGSFSLKGFREPRTLMRVRGPRSDARGPTSNRDDATPLVGREGEVASLRALWDHARKGEGRSALVRGDAGVGKSRLTRTLRDMVAEVGGLKLEARCSQFFTNTAMRPIADAIAQLVGSTDESGEPRLPDVETTLSQLGLPLDETVPLLAGLLGIPLPASRYAEPALLPQARKQKVIALVLQVLRATAARRPCLFLVEDLHWVDASTMEVLGALIHGVRTSPLLVVMTSRAGEAVPWDVDTEISLARLPRDAVERIITHVAGNKRLPDEVVQQIILKADGNPLFVEELTLMVLESGLLVEEGDGYRPAVVPIPPLAIPTTLHDSLMARLDRLAPTHKALVQLCATIGRQISYELIVEVLRSFEEELQNELRRLTDGELLFQRGAPPRSMFVFRHALIQDAAYGSLLRRTRVRYHGRVADVLRARFPGTPAEVFAHHLTEASRFEEAIAHWHSAGRAALGSFGLAEAIHHLNRGLALVGQIPDASTALVAEMSLRATLGMPLIFRHGFASPVVVENFNALLDLCSRAGTRGTHEQLVALWGLWQHHEVSARYDRAQEMGDRLLQLAELTGDTSIAVAAHTALGAALLMPGRFEEAQREFEQGLAIYDMAAHKHLALWFGQDVGAMCASFSTWVHQLQGDAAAAEASAQRAMAMSDALGQVGTRAFVETVLATWCCFAGDAARAERHADVVVRLAVEQGMPHWEAQAQITRGWAFCLSASASSPAADRARAEEGVTLMRRYTAALMGMGARASMAFYFSGIIDGELRLGRLEAARASLDEANAYVASTNERLHDAAYATLAARLNALEAS